MGGATLCPRTIGYKAMSKTVLLLATMALAVLLASGMATTSGAAAGDTTRVSVDSSGGQANSISYSPSVNSDGRFIAFESDASNLVANDTNGDWDVFVRDLQTRTTERVSVDSSGTQAIGASFEASISSDGRFVAFNSRASNLVSGDTNSRLDVFVRDLQTGTTQRVSVDSSGTQANGISYSPSISSDGHFVAFTSDARNLVPSDTNSQLDVFVRDLQTGTTERVSVRGTDTQADGASYSPSVNSDGRFIAFESDASNLVANDTNGDWDVFVRDLQTGTTERVSVDSSGAQATRASFSPSIGSDGRFVAFISRASNLVANDTNGDWDVFVRDLQTRTTERVSVDSSGAQATGASFWPGSLPSISSDGHFVAFTSDAPNLVPGYNRWNDVLVHDRQTGTTQRVSVDSLGTPAKGWSQESSISSDGRLVVFQSYASNLVVNDTNVTGDIFVHEFKLDTTAPKVVSVVPDRGVTGVPRGVNVKATFSEPVYNVRAGWRKYNFQLYRKGSSTPVDAVVTPIEGTNRQKWVLNPDGPLKAGTIYIAKILTNVKDKAGHNLDQHPAQAGDQPMKWSFKT
jgi:Tol biopolymer transport system component